MGMPASVEFKIFEVRNRINPNCFCQIVENGVLYKIEFQLRYLDVRMGGNSKVESAS